MMARLLLRASIPCVSLKTRFSDYFDYNNNGRVECTTIITNLIYNHQQDDAAISTIFSTILIVTSEEVRHGLPLLPLPPGGEDAPMAKHPAIETCRQELGFVKAICQILCNTLIHKYTNTQNNVH